MHASSALLRRSLPIAIAGLAYAASSLLFFGRWPELYDTDSYYHLAVSRAYWQEGLIENLRWARFSVMAHGFGDKELLLHLFLAPFAGPFDPVRGGQVALAIFHGGLAAVVIALTRPLLGRWSYALPLGLVFGSMEVAWRLVRLRAELLSLLLLLIALALIAQRRYRWLGVVALLYTLGYTAFHALVGLCVLVFAYRWLVRREPEPSLIVYPALGSGVGLMVHPHFPSNLTVWWLQTFGFFAEKARLDVGSEIQPNSTDVSLLANLGFWLLLVVLWRSAVADPSIDEARWRPWSDAFGVAGVIFTLLYLLMSRFSLYAMPLLALWLLFELARRGRRPSGRLTIGDRIAIPGSVALGIVALIALPIAAQEVARYASRVDQGPGGERWRDRASWAAALAPDAPVAARWQQTGLYMLLAPEARYLNVLDPVFMARPHAAAYDAQRSLFSGSDPDPPVRLLVDLDSRYLAVSRSEPTGALLERLAGDPRMRPLHIGANTLWEVIAPPDESFVIGWRRAPDAGQEAPSSVTEIETWSPLPLPPPELRPLHGWIDLDAGEPGCVMVATSYEARGRRRLRLAPWGPTTLWNGEEQVATVPGNEGNLGRPVVLELESASDRLSVRTCSATGRDGRVRRGFYLMRGREDLASSEIDSRSVPLVPDRGPNAEARKP